MCTYAVYSVDQLCKLDCNTELKNGNKLNFGYYCYESKTQIQEPAKEDMEAVL